MIQSDLRLLQTMLNETHELVSFVDREYYYRAVNMAYTDRYKRPRGEIVGKNLAELMSAETFKKLRQNIDRCFDGEKLEYEMWFEFANEERRYMLVSYVPYHEEDGSISGAIVFAKDYTEQENRRLEQKQTQELLIQQAKMTDIGKITSFLSHQWREPLQSLASYMYKMRRDIETRASPEEHIKSMDRCEEIIEHLSETMQIFTSFYRVEKNSERFLIKESIEHILKIIQKRIQNLNVCIELNIDKELSLVGKKGEWMHVLFPIITNSLDAFEERKTKNPTIRFDAYALEKKLHLLVQDNAGGIAPIDKDSLFTIFSTTKQNGSGLGLYFSRLIIREKFAGDITAKEIEDGVLFELVASQLDT